MQWIDGHLDLAYLAVNGRDITKLCAPTEGGCVSLPALREAGVVVVFGTIFTEPAIHEDVSKPHVYEAADPESAHRAGVAQLRVYEKLEAAGELSIVRRRGDLDGGGGFPRVVILMEGVDPIRSPSEAEWWFKRGVRLVGMAWAMGTRYAAGNAHIGEARSGGLSARGRELVAALDELGIVHDASHLSDAAFDDLLKTCSPSARIVATHSNSRAVMGDDNQRHLTDKQIRMIAERDGVVGLNLYGKFLCREGRATVEDCLRHVEHVVGVFGEVRERGGREHRCGVALGSDMDGGFGPEALPVGIEGPGGLIRLAEGLRGRGWSGTEVADFAAGRWRRMLEAALPE